MMEFPYPISEELLRVLMIRAAIGPIPFSIEHPPSYKPSIHHGDLRAPHSPSMVEWVWMAIPPTGTSDVPALAFGLPLVVAPALVAQAAEAG